MNHNILKIGKEVILILKKANYEAYFVGGCVRDLLLKKEIKDVDIATNATPDEITELFTYVIPIGVEHGTVLVRYKNRSFEITTFRTEGTYSDQRHPDYVNFIQSIDEDLKRRDFTINAMAMDETGKIIDLFRAKEDLNNKIIRAVGNPKERFLEDPLRILRAIRFASQLGFDIDKNTLEQMIAQRIHLKTVAVERITEEMKKFFASEHVNKGLQYLKKAKLHEQLPVFKWDSRLIELLPKQMPSLSKFSEVITIFHLLHPKYQIHEWIKEWKLSNQTKKEASHLVRAFTDYQNKGLHPLLVFKLPDYLFKSFVTIVNVLTERNITLESVITIQQKIPIQSEKQLVISGADLMELFPECKPGPWIQQTLDELIEKVVCKELENDFEELKEWVICNPPKIVQ